MSTTTMGSGGNDSQLMNYLVRMIVPMRREFGRSVDVQQFLHDFAYAKEVIDQALGSQDARLREYANYVQQRYHGARVADSPPPAAVGADAAVEPKAPPTASSTAADEAELRARMLKKYTSGLR
ncbi:hypothetical protein [Piscinibacter sp. HJYY11]|uniref:hypothetical protein n=1 Tax=Piscinibacter sp. HJYY11 TaxID=2801333 RepID=UPI00191D5ECC|nr:hypothetical protein [Piscinibacter sp. HJYY11]MBL0727493.1 hypothetical protein [Piscinibacter sp. HJYY11]